MVEYHKIQTVFKRDMNTKYKTLLEEEYSLPEFDYLKNNIWDWSEKLDGCLHYGNEIITDRGNLPIGKIVEEKLPLKVLSYNETMDCVEFQDIEYYHKEERKREFLTVLCKSRKKGNKPKAIVCTDNHKFYSSGNWIQAKDLKEGQKISHLIDQIPYGVKQIILGTLLGDGCIYRPSETTRGFSFIHSIKQKEYFDFKKFLLGKLFTETKGYIGGFDGSLPNKRGSSIVNRAISKFIIEHCEKNGCKYITKEWIKELSPLGIAIWYMDDGSVQLTNKQKPRVHFATNAFSYEEVSLLKDMFKNKYNIACEIFDYKGNTLCLSTEGTSKLFDLIFPYIPNCMEYKLPIEYRNFTCCLTKEFNSYLSIEDTEIIKITTDLPVMYKGQQKYQYDLTIKNNSNYFSKSILVHNTNIRIEWDGINITFGGKTENAQIPQQLVNNLNLTFLPKKSLFVDIFKESNVTLFGEGVGNKIQKGGGNYRQDQGFVLFDIRIDNWWMNRDVVNGIADQLGIEYVPKIGEGTLLEMVEFTRKGFNSQWGNFIAEGIVARPKVELYTRSGHRIITKIKYKDFDHKGVLWKNN